MFLCCHLFKNSIGKLISDHNKYNDDMCVGGVYLHFQTSPIAVKPIE